MRIVVLPRFHKIDDSLDFMVIFRIIVTRYWFDWQNSTTSCQLLWYISYIGKFNIRSLTKSYRLWLLIWRKCFDMSYSSSTTNNNIFIFNKHYKFNNSYIVKSQPSTFTRMMPINFVGLGEITGYFGWVCLIIREEWLFLRESFLH